MVYTLEGNKRNGLLALKTLRVLPFGSYNKEAQEAVSNVGREISGGKHLVLEVDLTKGETFSFLGFEFNWRKSSFSGKMMAYYEPREKRVQAIANDISRQLRRLWRLPFQEVIEALNRKLRGWVNYFRIGHSNRVFKESEEHYH